VGVGGSFLGVSNSWCEINHLPPFSAEVKNEWSYTSAPLVCLYGLDRDKFTFKALTGIFLNPIVVMTLMELVLLNNCEYQSLSLNWTGPFCIISTKLMNTLNHISHITVCKC
jgi:hypothetical protein